MNHNAGYWPVTRVESWGNSRPRYSMRPNPRTINFYRLHSLWMDSYNRDANHALRDAHRNLKGFTRIFMQELENHQVDNAFNLAIKKVLRNV